MEKVLSTELNLFPKTKTMHIIKNGLTIDHCTFFHFLDIIFYFIKKTNFSNEKNVRGNTEKERTIVNVRKSTSCKQKSFIF